MVKLSIKTIATHDTDQSADSVEWCPQEGWEHLFVCGTYQLERDEHLSSANRMGRILLHHFDAETEGDPLSLLQTVERSAVLDQKWNPIVKNSLAVAGADGAVCIYGLEQTADHKPRLEEQKTSTLLGDETDERNLLALALDWSSDGKRLVVSDSHGCVELFTVECGLQSVHSWKAHGFEAWTCAFSRHDENVIFSGGDDCMLCVHDIRCPSQPITKAKNKSHSAGVTSLLSFAQRDHVLLTGSYDENIRFFDERQLKGSISELALQGGVWRLRSNPHGEPDRILCACMYHNFSVVQLLPDDTFELVGEYGEHESICYGCDWQQVKTSVRPGKRVIATCSFYDHKLFQQVQAKMASRLPQKTPCNVITAIWNILSSTANEEIEHTRLAKQLTKTLTLASQDDAEQHIKTALTDGLLTQSTRIKPRGKQKPNTVYTFPQWQTFAFADDWPDACCYECHTTGELLKCDGCVRSFHEHCVKSTEEKQLELEQFVSKQKRIPTSAFSPRVISIRHSSTASPATLTEESNVSSARDFSPANVTQQHGEDSLPETMDIELGRVPQPCELYTTQQVKHESTAEECPVSEDVKLEHDVKGGIVSDEAMFVCMVRPPDRRREKSRSTPTVKPEESVDAADDTTEQVRDDAVRKRYCYACRLLKDSANNAPPNVGKHELNYLLNFIVKQYKSWVPEDTYSVSKLGKGKPRHPLGLERKTIEVCKKMLLRTPKTIAVIREKIDEDQYSSLEEFHVDLLDIAHNVAIIHGASSFDYSAVMYLVADCVYDLYEIRRCPDCFRHSNEKAEAGWFARPCRTRHELVYAKQKSYQYWPAKVIRVLNNKYDVRFFGDKHLRALIDANWVKPIDTDLRTLGVNNKQRGFQLAMEEMLKHQSLIDGFREHYAFGVGTGQLPAILVTPGTGGTGMDTAPERHHETPPAGGGKSVGAKRTKRSSNQTVAHEEMSNATPVLEANTRVRVRSARTKRRETVDHPETPMKKTRSQHPLESSSTGSTGKKASQQPQQQHQRQNNNTLNGNYNAPESNSTRLPRTKQNQMLRFSENQDAFRLKTLFHQVSDPVQLKEVALKILQDNEERFARRLEWLKETHNQEIRDIKKKQWCRVCEQEASMRCCWSMYYCSRVCQTLHWSTHRTDHQQELGDNTLPALTTSSMRLEYI
uniref:MYND-type domain-containing protein n=1 Tax=Anopheles dirus TaxID=7168 RepID=A0A182N748_9DIPT